MTTRVHAKRSETRHAALATAPITVVCADRYELARLGVAYLTRRYPDLQFMGEVATLAEVPAMLARTRPAVVVIGDDLSPSGGTFAAGLRAAHPGIGVVVVSHHTDDSLFHRYRASGVSAFVSRSAPATAVLAAIRHAAANPTRFRTFGVPWAVEWHTEPAPALSRREQQVLELLREGLPAGDIAATLQVGRGSVRTYVTRLYAKLGVTNRSQALVAAAVGTVNGEPR